MRARRRRKKPIGSGWIVAAVVLVAALMLGALYFIFNQADGTEPETGDEPAVVENVVADLYAEQADALLGEMSMSDKIYQLMFVTPESITGVKTVIRAGDATKEAIEAHPVGGIIYFAHNFESREQTYEMIANSQEYSETSLFIGVDEEGGTVSRLGSNPEMGVTEIGAMEGLGITGDKESAYNAGSTLALDLSALGFNVNFAPVADVVTDEDEAGLGSRSFGPNAEMAAAMVESVVCGLQDNAVSATLKHFPGIGSSSADSHKGYAESTRTLEELREKEFLPFKKGIDAGADFVMVSHVAYVNATEGKLPASLSKEIVTDMLRTELGFDGIVITDAFDMDAITEEYSPEEAVVKAISAGVDMILMPSDVKAAHEAITAAVDNGEITEERINESVRRILKLKLKKGII